MSDQHRPAVLHDDDVVRLADMGAAIAAIEALFAAQATGRLIAPPRHFVPFGKRTELVFSVGGELEGAGGTRAYYSRNGRHLDDQLVVVWDMVSGGMRGIILGHRLGILRMGAIGGVAIRHLTDPAASTLAVIGAGRQAEAHLEAAALVRRLSHVQVSSRDPARAADFCRRMSTKVGVAVEPAATAQEAVADAQIVVLATSSLTPVIRAEWLSPSAFVHSVGYKSPVAKEMGLDVPDRAAALFTDSPAQIESFGAKFILHGSAHAGRVQPLHAVIARTGVRPASGIAVCYPMGIAGADIAVASDLLTRHTPVG